MSAPRPRCVTFDAGNTLLFAHPAPPVLYAEAFSRHGHPVSPETVGPVFKQAWAEMQRRTMQGRDRYGSVEGGERAWWGELLREVLHRLDHDAAWEDLLEDLYEAFAQAEVWRVFPEVRQTLSTLRDRRHRLAVISNWDRRLPQLLAELELDQYLEVITVSAIEGVEKPDPEIFRRTVERLGVAPEEAIHVGDSLREDYRGAEAAGLTPVLVDRRGLFSEDPTLQRIESLDEVLHLAAG